MKIQLDTTLKTVKIENDIKISQLLDTLKKLLPGEWQSFTLLTNTTIVNWANPYHYDRQTVPYVYPWYNGAMNKAYDSLGSNDLPNDYPSQAGKYGSNKTGLLSENLRDGIYNVSI